MSNEINSSDDEKFISSAELIDVLQTLILKIKDGKFTDVDLQDIYDSLSEYNGMIQRLDPRTVAYLFRGWWLTSIFEQVISTTPEKCSQCPYCLRPLDSSEDKD